MNEALKQFLLAPKPSWCIPADVAVLAVLSAGLDKPYPGHSIVSARAGLSSHDVKSLMRALKRLQAAGWIQMQKEKTDYQNVQYGFTVVFDNLPKGESQ
jgi:hypothetical protein